jgi:nitrite reductase (NO-forming)
MTIEDRRRRRVVASHRIAVTALRLAAVFGVGAIGWALWVLWNGGSWWGPIHTFLLGTVTLAIAGATQLFTITWSAAPAPLAATAAAQRWLQSAGAITVLVGMTVRSSGAVLVGGVLVIAGVAVLAFSLVSAVRHSLLRRFDLSARFYLLGFGCAIVGVVLGILMGIDIAEDSPWFGEGVLSYVHLRTVHGHLNLVGFIGFTIIGTLPTILPTFAHHRAVSGTEAKAAWILAIGAGTAMTAGLLLGEPAVGFGTLLAAGALLTILTGVVVRLGKTGLRGGLPYFQVVAGSIWLAVWAVVDATRLFTDQAVPPFDRWIAAAVIAGVGQVLFGSLAYLVPVLLGPGPRLTRNFERMDAHRWVPLTALNGAAVALIAEVPTVTLLLLAVWLADLLRRLIGLERAEVATP